MAMGHIIGERGAQTRDELLAQATLRFSERGYRDTSVSQIARDVGLKQAAVYRYFPSKEALFDAAVLADMEAVIAAAFDAPIPLPFPDALPGFFLRIQATADEHPLISRVLANQEPGVLARLVDSPTVRTFEGALREQMREGQHKGEIRSDIDIDLVARGYETIIFALLIARASTGPDPHASGIAGVLAVTDAALRPAAVVAPSPNSETSNPHP
ncbi:MAG: AcrR family transcriptional regulator [Candidatus Aldehydirespiratoraceae bacterium]|jgi:AcrR family transcriptional regulator